jgi:hypothetical protein
LDWSPPPDRSDWLGAQPELLGKISADHRNPDPGVKTGWSITDCDAQRDLSLAERFGRPITREANQGRDHDRDEGYERELER